MDNALSCYDNGGAQVWCCEDHYVYTVTTVTVDAQLKAYQDAAAAFVKSPSAECAAYGGGLGGGGGLKRRSQDKYALSTLQSRQTSGISGSAAVAQMVSLLYAILTSAIDASDMLKEYHATCKKIPIVWSFIKIGTNPDDLLGDNAMTQLGFTYLLLKSLTTFFDTDIRYKFMSNTDKSKNVPCSLELYNNAIKAGANDGSPTATKRCDQWTIVRLNNDFFDGDEDFVDSQSARKRRAISDPAVTDYHHHEEEYHHLEKRDGAPRPYTVTLGTDSNGNPQIIIIYSWVYPNGRNGQALVDATGVNIRYSLADNGDCSTAVYAETGDPEDVPAWAGKSFPCSICVL